MAQYAAFDKRQYGGSSIGRGRSCRAVESAEEDPMQNLVLYNAPQSTCSQRVRFTLHEKGLSFSELKLDLFSGDQLRPEYLKINPNGVVPSLVHNGRVIIDSAVIIEYLSEVFPESTPLVTHVAAGVGVMGFHHSSIDVVPYHAVLSPTCPYSYRPYNLAA